MTQFVDPTTPEKPFSSFAHHMIPKHSVYVATLSLAFSMTAQAVEQVRHIGLYVQPYYSAAQDRFGNPQVSVSKAHDNLLASTNFDDIVLARDQIAKNNSLITPMTLMVLAIRLYDIGLRDDAVFWFYAAKDRYTTLAAVAEMNSPALAQVEDAVRNFAVLAGPFINGYAFCNIEKQKATREAAFQWTAANPYLAVLSANIPAKPGDRRANLESGLATARDRIAKESQFFSDEVQFAKFRQGRKDSSADEKYCWK